MSMEKKPRQFTFPTAFTILFILLVLIALATWVIPAGSYELDADGAPIPGTYQQVPSNPQKLLVSALMGPMPSIRSINRLRERRRVCSKAPRATERAKLRTWAGSSNPSLCTTSRPKLP